MKIGVMLRCIDERQGIGVYTKNLLDHLLPMDPRNEYILFYKTSQHLGRYARYRRVREKVVSAPNKLMWDQLMIPIEARRHKVDVLFNPKFTVPIFTSSKTAMVLHGSAWYVDPQSYKRMDLVYIKIMMPVYHRMADMVIAVSDCAKNDMSRFIGADSRKFRTIYSAADDRFLVQPSSGMVEAIRSKYSLPERFILNVGSVSTAKNIKNLLIAFSKVCRYVPHKLVIVGRKRHGAATEVEIIEQEGLQDKVVFTGWIPQEDMPAIYAASEVFVFPSWYESCSVALLEAMASGCPIVTSDTGGTPELTGDAATLVSPSDPEAIAEGIRRVLTNPELRASLSLRSRQRSKEFAWDKCARETLDALETIGCPQLSDAHSVDGGQKRSA